MTTFKLPEDVQTSLAMIWEYAREMGHKLKPDFEIAIYHNINVNEDRDRAFGGQAVSRQLLLGRLPLGHAKALGDGRFALTLRSKSTKIRRARTNDYLLRVAGYDQKGQFKRVTEEILPAFG